MSIRAGGCDGWRCFAGRYRRLRSGLQLHVAGNDDTFPRQRHRRQAGVGRGFSNTPQASAMIRHPMSLLVILEK
jgi:hypothetical protein